MKNWNLIVLSLLSIMLFTSCDQLEDIFGNENNEATAVTELYYVKNETEGVDMITDNVDHIIFIETDSETLDKTIKGGRMDTKSEKCIDKEAFVIYMDSLNRVSTILLDDMICNFYNYKETSCDIVFINSDGTYESVENISLSQDKFALPKTRSYSGEEFIDDATKVIEGVKASFELALSICKKNPHKIKTTLDFFDYMSVAMSGGLSFGTNSATMGLNAKLYNLKPDLFSICMYLIESGRTLSEFLTEQHIGDWKLELISIEQVNAKTAEIVFNVSGIKENPSVKLSGYVWYMNMDNRSANNIPFKVENNTYRMYMPFDSYGSFSGKIDLVGAFGFRKSEYFKFNAYNLGLSKYEIEENPLYENGAVNFKMNVFLKGNEDGLKGIQQFGYYIKYANAIDYKVVNNLSSIFESTPLTYELSIPRDGFSDETINYTTFEAKPSIDYYIGVYVVLKNGKIVHFDEETIDGLVYNTEPSIGYNKVSVLGTSQIDSYTYDDGSIAYKYETNYTFEGYITGAFWIQDISSTCSGSYTYEGTDLQVISWGARPSSDCIFNMESGIRFWDNKLEPCTVSLQLTLDNGRTINADNSLYIAVNPTNTSISIIGGRSIQRSFNTNTTHKPKKNDSNNPIKVIPCNKIKLN